MEHVLLKSATPTATDQGYFEAVISSASVDREKDIVSPTGMVSALRQWETTGKNIPLTWHHSTDAADIIGHIDPSSAKAVGNEVVVSGWVDQSTRRGKDAWRLVKSGTLGFSFGYLPLDYHDRKGGGRDINALDVFEITATAIPMNPDTRVVGWKASMTLEEQRELAEAYARQAEAEQVPDVPAEESISDEPVAVHPTPPDAKSQLRRAADLERESAQEASLQRRREEEAGLPAIPAASTEPKRDEPTLPPIGDQRRRATEMERLSERAAIRERRQREESQIADIPPAPPSQPQPEPRLAVVPDAVAQRRKATELEQVMERSAARERRQQEENQIPSVAGQPTPESAPSVKVPDTEEQWRRSVDLAREVVKMVREEERQRLPDVPALPAEPNPEPVQREPAPDTRSQLRKAAALEREATAERRREQDQRMPTIPEPAPDPEPEPKRKAPETRAQRRKAAEMEREMEHARRREEEKELPASTERLEVKAASDVGPAARAHLRGLLDYYRKKPHPFGACVKDNRKRFGPGTERVCAVLKDLEMGTTHWRHGGGKAVGDQTMPDAEAIDAMVQELYDAAGGDLEKLLEMLWEHMAMHGDQPDMMGPPSKSLDLEAPDIQIQRAKAAKYEREAQRAAEVGEFPNVPDDLPGFALLRVSNVEMDGLADGSLKAVWSAAFENDLPDSCFLYVAPGGKKDSDGKTTPRSLRYFPYKNSDGSVDLPHLRNALARIPQSNLPQDVKDRLTKKARSILDSQNSKSADALDGTTVPPADPLRKHAEAVALEFASDGESLRKPPRQKVASKPKPRMTLAEMEQQARDEVIKAISGMENI